MAAKWQQWMPFHIDRFRGSPDVRAMHPAAQMGYLYLLASAWQTDDCTISSDELDLASDSCLGDELWALYRVRIMRKFSVLDSGRMRNEVLFEEWSETKRVWEEKQMTPEERAELAKKRSAAGIAGNEKRWSLHRKNKMIATVSSQNIAKCDCNTPNSIANDRLTLTITNTDIKNSSSNNGPSTETARENLEQEEKIYKSYCRHVGKRDAIKGIRKAVERIVKGDNSHPPIKDFYEARRFLCKKVLEYSASISGREPAVGEQDYRPHPATWFNDDRFWDNPEEWKKPTNGGMNGKQIGKTEKNISAGAAAAREVIESETNYSIEDYREIDGDDVFSRSRGESKLFSPNVGSLIEGKI